ncbi:hypothetical protein ES703_47105 [subsurface metagenome]
MPERSADWMKQALRDLESAKAQKQDEFFEWSCFISQQAAEKALKAVFQKIGAEAWGHSLLELIRALKEKINIPQELEVSARYLDRFYIPARYQNGWASGTPSCYITLEDAEHANNHSEKIVQCSIARFHTWPAPHPARARLAGHFPQYRRTIDGIASGRRGNLRKDRSGCPLFLSQFYRCRPPSIPDA